MHIINVSRCNKPLNAENSFGGPERFIIVVLYRMCKLGLLLPNNVYVDTTFF